MEYPGSGKRKNRLAVFEHVVEKEKNVKNNRRKLVRLNSEDSSQSESELVIHDKRSTGNKKEKKALVKLTEEPLNLQCDWNGCNDTEVFDSWEKFNTHLIEHATNSSGNYECQWDSCTSDGINNVTLLTQHMSYHAYVTKIKNIGDNIVERHNLPECKETHPFDIPLSVFGYKCEWEYCSYDVCTIFEFLNHMQVHIKNNPKVSNAKESIFCCWKGCNTKYGTQVKLAEHMRIHTKERIIGCSSCSRLFTNKTKFCDHRKRQLSLSAALQTYQCSQCLKLFPTERLLRDHMRSHVNHYKCTMCDMTCSKPSILAKHIRFKHIKFKPYKCTQCDKSFVEKHNLNTHLKTHEVENPCKCYLCDFECRSKAGLDNHYVKKHASTGLMYECHCCKKKFKRGTFLTKHLTKVHNYHWPSGHSRFRYRKDQDGIYRLQTVRYESLEVTQEMIRSESMQTSNVKEAVTYNLKYDNDGKSGYVLTISENGEQSVRCNAEKDKGDNNVYITVSDLDERGNILNCQIHESTVLPANQLPSLDNAVAIQNDDEHVEDSNESVEDNDERAEQDDDDESEYQSDESNGLDADEITVEENKFDVSSLKEESDNLSNTTILDYQFFKNSIS